MKKGKRIGLLFIAAALIFTLILPTAAFAEGEEIKGAVSSSGSFKWTFDPSTETMTVEGKGTVDSQELNYTDANMQSYSDFVYYLSKAKKLVFSEGVTKIGSSFTVGGYEVKQVVLPSTLKTIGSWAFGECTSLTKINFPSKLTSIGSDAFIYCDLGSIRLPDSLISIGREAFSSSRVKSLKLPVNLKTIGEGAFQSMSALTKITVASGNKYFTVKSGSLYNKAKTRLVWVSPAKEGTYTIASTVTNAGGAFAENSKITEVVIPAKLSADKVYSTLQYMTNLRNITVSSANTTCTSVGGVLYNKKKTALLVYPAAKGGDYVMPPTVTTADGDAFYNARRVKSITLSKGFKDEGYLTWPNCASFKTFKVAAGNKSYAAVNGFLFNAKKTKLIRCPSGKSGSVTVPKNTKTIESGAFEGCRYITSVTMPSTVTSVGEYAFNFCTRLEKIKLSANIKTIKMGTFWNCSKLTSVTLPTALTTIEEYAFENCRRLASVTIPKNVGKISPGAFAECPKLTGLKISKYNTKLSFKNGALYNADGTVLKFYLDNSDAQIWVADGVETIDADAFINCTKLEEVILPASVSKVCAFAFENYYITDIMAKVVFEGDCPTFEYVGPYFGDDGSVSYVNYEFANFANVIEIVYNEGAAGFDKYPFINCTLKAKTAEPPRPSNDVEPLPETEQTVEAA